MHKIEDIKSIDRVRHEVERYGEKELKYWRKYDFFKLHDGLVVYLSGARAKAIEREIYESDEDEQGRYRTSSDIAPNNDALKRLFMARNLRELRNYTKYLDERPFEKLYISKPVYTNSNLRQFVVRSASQIDAWHDVEREATPEELAALKQWEDEQMLEMTDRLEKYWKRYGDKVGITTYWANR